MRGADDPVDLICFFVVCVITQFFLGIKDDEDAARYADGKSGNINECVWLVSEELSDGDGDIIFDHAPSKIRESSVMPYVKDTAGRDKVQSIVVEGASFVGRVDFIPVLMLRPGWILLPVKFGIRR